MSTKIRVAPLCTSRCVRRWLMLRVTTCFLIIHREPVPLHPRAASHSNTRHRWLYVCCRRRIYASVNWVIIQSDNGLSPNGTKPLSEPMLDHYQLNLLKQNSVTFQSQFMGADPALAGIPLVTLSLKTGNFFTKHVKFTSFSLNDRSIFPVKICTYATLLSYTTSYFDPLKLL